MKMRRILTIAVWAALMPISMTATNDSGQPVMMLTGASFAVPENGWFEIACGNMDAEAINKAVSGEAIYHTARRMHAGTFYTATELERTDVLVIGHVHNQNVANEQWIKESWEDYTNIASTTDYSVAYDYVIKRYIADCKALESNPGSKYFGTPGGKPARIILCTHWHDARTTFNPAIRKLASRWGFPLVEFDKNIGFSKEDAASGEPQPSLAMAHDSETIGGVKYGWHPLRGSATHIQQRMAQIFLDVAKTELGIDVPFRCEAQPLSPLVAPGETASVMYTFNAGHYPFSIDYSAGCGSWSNECLNDAKLIVDAPGEGEADFGISSLADATGMDAALPATLKVGLADKTIYPSFDGYIHEAYKDQSFTGNETLQLKNGDNWSRKIYITFPVEDMAANASKVVFRLFFDSYVLGTLNNEKRPMDGFETIEVGGNTDVYGSTLKWSTHASHEFEPIASAKLVAAMAGKWIGWDVTDWVKARIAAGAKHLTFRVTTPYRWRSLTSFVAMENGTSPHLAPQMLFAMENESSVRDDIADKCAVDISGDMLRNPSGRALRIFSADGRVLYSGSAESISLAGFSPGMYICSAPTGAIKFAR